MTKNKIPTLYSIHANYRPVTMSVMDYLPGSQNELKHSLYKKIIIEKKQLETLLGMPSFRDLYCSSTLCQWALFDKKFNTKICVTIDYPQEENWYLRQEELWNQFKLSYPFFINIHSSSIQSNLECKTTVTKLLKNLVGSRLLSAVKKESLNDLFINLNF